MKIELDLTPEEATVAYYALVKEARDFGHAILDPHREATDETLAIWRESEMMLRRIASGLRSVAGLDRSITT